MNDVFSLIQKDLMRHKVKVTLPGKDQPETLYLIETTAKANMIDILVMTYGEQLVEFNLKVARRIYKDEEQDWIFGVLVDKTASAKFAFCREIADYDKVTKTISYVSIEEVLLSGIPGAEKNETTGQKLDIIPSEFIERQLKRSRCSDRGCIQNFRVTYALVEKTED